MDRYTFVTEEGNVLFHPAELPDDEGITITQLAQARRYYELEQIAEKLANAEQRLEKQFPEWIPVSERMPDESDYYCVTTEDTATDIRIEQTIWFAHKDDYDIEESEWRELEDYEKVIAWRKSDPYSPGN